MPSTTVVHDSRHRHAAFALDDDWGTLVWLVMTTGMRRGEVCALRWRNIDFDDETIEIRRSYILHRGVGVEKDTKTHQMQMRRIALDSETVTLLREHRERVRRRVEELAGVLTEQTFVFAGVRRPDHSEPYPPHAVSSRLTTLARPGDPTHTLGPPPRPVETAVEPDIETAVRPGGEQAAADSAAHDPVGFQKLAAVPELRFQAAASYWLIGRARG